MNTKNPAFYVTKFLLLLLLFVSAQLFSMQSAMAASQPYTKLPPEVAEEMKWMAWNAAWAAANHRFVSREVGAKSEEPFNKHSEAMKKKAVGLEGVSQSTLDDIKWFAWNAAWSTANGRSALRYFSPTDQVYWLNKAAENAKTANEHLQRVKNSGQLAPELVQSINEMVWAAAWHAANTKAGFQADAEYDRQAFDIASTKIPGDIRLVDIIEGTVTEDTTKLIRTVADLPEPYTNCNNIVQHEQFSKSITYENTSSWSHVLGFNYSSTTGAGVEAGTVFAKVSGSMSFTTGYTSEETWNRSTTKRIGATKTTDVKVEARTQTTVRAVFYQRVLKAPYDIIYSIEGKEYKVHGEWVGTAEFSKIIWGPSIRINPATHPDCTGRAAASSTNDEVNITASTEATTTLVEANHIFLPLIANAGAVTDEGNVITKTEATLELATDERNDTVMTAATLELGSAEADGTLTAETMTDVASAELNLTAATETLVGGTESNRIYLPLIANNNL